MLSRRQFMAVAGQPVGAAVALAFTTGIGSQRKDARLRYLRDCWATHPSRKLRVQLHTSLRPEFSCGLALVQIEGVGSGKLADHLWGRHRIIVAAIKHDEFEGIRVAPSVYTTPDEIDRFGEAIEGVLEKGLPTA